MSDTTDTTTDTSLRQLSTMLAAHGHQQLDTQRDATVDEFVNAFSIARALIGVGEIKPKQITALTEFLRRVNDEDSRDAALADLGTGGGTGTISDRAALQQVLNSTSLPLGTRLLIERAVNPSHEDHIRVDATGTPVEIAALTERNRELEEAAQSSGTGAPSAQALRDAEVKGRKAVKQEIAQQMPAIAKVLDTTLWAKTESRHGLKKALDGNVGLKHDIPLADYEAADDAVKAIKGIKDEPSATPAPARTS